MKYLNTVHLNPFHIAAHNKIMGHF